jgi:hypothetical protein
MRRTMEGREPTRILVVANRTAATPRLLDELRRRAQAGPCEFALLIPEQGGRAPADWGPGSALPLLRRASRSPVEGLTCGDDAYTAVARAVRDGGFDEIIVSTLPRRMSKWLRRDLIRRVQGLGLPVTAIVPGGAPATGTAADEIVASRGSRGL